MDKLIFYKKIRIVSVFVGLLIIAYSQINGEGLGFLFFFGVAVLFGSLVITAILEYKHSKKVLKQNRDTPFLKDIKKVILINSGFVIFGFFLLITPAMSKFGIIVVLVAVAHGWIKFRCPYCSASLYEVGPRLNLEYCPKCKKDLAEFKAPPKKIKL